MTDEKIDLEEILLRNLINLSIATKFSNEEIEEIKSSPWFRLHINAMREACQETLRLASENAKIKESLTVDDKAFVLTEYVIDKRSILDTIHQIQ